MTIIAVDMGRKANKQTNKQNLHHMLLKIRKTIWKVSCPLSLPLLKFPNLPISIKIPVALLQIVYICLTSFSPISSL